MTSHELRSLATSLRIGVGASSFLVMKAGGWSSLDMVLKVYGHLWPSSAAQPAATIDAVDLDELA